MISRNVTPLPAVTAALMAQLTSSINKLKFNKHRLQIKTCHSHGPVKLSAA